MFGVKNAHLTPVVWAMRRTSSVTQTLNKRNANSYWAGFVRCLFLSFKRTACRVSLNLTAHNFVDELSWETIAHHDLLNAT